MRRQALNDIRFGSGEVVWNDLYFDPQLPLAEQQSDLRDDLLFVRYPNGSTIDVGWLPEFDASGSYLASLNRKPREYEPCLTVECRSIAELEVALKRLASMAEDEASD